VIYCPGGATGFSPGFQLWEPPTQATRPERAPDQTYKKQTRGSSLYRGPQSLNFVLVRAI
jgi:hypothetical protein